MWFALLFAIFCKLLSNKMYFKELKKVFYLVSFGIAAGDYGDWNTKNNDLVRNSNNWATTASTNGNGRWENSQMYKKLDEIQRNKNMRAMAGGKSGKSSSSSSSSDSSSSSSSSSSSQENNKSKSKNNRNPYRGVTFNHILQTTKDKENRNRLNY